MKNVKHMFDVEIAKQIGVNCAIILENLSFWIEKNAANGTNFYDGYYWTFNSIEAFEKLFPYMTKKQIRTALAKLEDEKLIITGNYNAIPYDRTKWYAITEKGNSICPTGQINFTYRANEIAPQGKPIPYINTYINTDNNNMSHSQAKLDNVTDVANEIIDYLNNKINTKYRANSETTKKLIKARINEGYTVQDFKTVIDKKYNSWYGTDLAVYIRPSTLFGSKFESYLNEQVVVKSKNKVESNTQSFDIDEYEKQLRKTPTLD